MGTSAMARHSIPRPEVSSAPVTQLPIEAFRRSTVEKLLLVADPQLIGERDEGFFGFVTRNDADR